MPKINKKSVGDASVFLKPPLNNESRDSKAKKNITEPINIKALIQLQKKAQELSEEYFKLQKTPRRFVNAISPINAKTQIIQPKVKKPLKSTTDIDAAKPISTPNSARKMTDPPKIILPVNQIIETPETSPSPEKKESPIKIIFNEKLEILNQRNSNNNKDDLKPIPPSSYRKLTASSKEEMERWNTMNSKINTILTNDDHLKNPTPTDQEYKVNVKKSWRDVKLVIKWSHPKYLNEKPMVQVKKIGSIMASHRGLVGPPKECMCCK